MLKGLLEIYRNWKMQLDKSGQAYYLKIWLFEPAFSQSQVVCAIGDHVDFYENTFTRPEIDKTIQLDKYGALKTYLSGLNWEHRIDEVYYDNTEVGEPDDYASKQDYEDTVKWFGKLLKKPHHTHKFNEPIGKDTECYFFKCGDVWIGGLK